MKRERTLFDLINAFDDIDDICKSIGVEVNTPAWTDKFGEALRNYIVDNNQPLIRTLSLFSGAGGLDIGFHDLGFDIISSVEIEDKFCATLKMNSGEGKFFSHSKVNCIDIREFTGDDLGQIDWIIGGPPCQTFSAAGRRASGVLGTSDARGVLFREYVRLLKHLNPKGFLFENVYGIVGAQGGEPWREIVDSFKDAGYNLFYRILDAADYGTPQHRERLIIIGLKDGNFEFPRPTHGPDSINGTPFYDAKTALEGLLLTDEEKRPGLRGRYGYLLDEIPPGLNYSFYTKELGHPNPIFAWRSKFSDFLYKADPNTPVRTIKASGGQYTGPLHWENRYFAYSEYKRLQTFPDKYAISGTKQIAVKQIGNSVPPQLARMLALAIRIQIFNTHFPFVMETLNPRTELTFRKRKRDLTKLYQQKAKEAIEKLNSTANILINRTDYFYLSLTDRFDYIKSDSDGTYFVHVKWFDKLLEVNVRAKGVTATSKVVIKILPNTTWSLPVDKVVMHVECADDWLAVTAAWKVFDRELIENSLKADLTQLNGYYQYKSCISCEVQTENMSNLNVMKPVISGLCTQRILTTRELSMFWGIKEDEVLENARLLKELGYEVRNINTNPQMKENEWLIPYKFPTFVPQSVQLYKKL